MKVVKTMCAIRHKESGLFYQSNDSADDQFIEFNLNIDLMSKDFSLTGGWDYYVSKVPEEFKEMFSKYLIEDSLVEEFYKVPPEDLELVKLEYSIKQIN